MMTLAKIVFYIDQAFSTLIFIPAIYILYCRFTAFHTKSRKAKNIYQLCLVFVLLFVLRIFCGKFIFTDVNYLRFTDSGLFPLIKAIFYPTY